MAIYAVALVFASLVAVDILWRGMPSEVVDEDFSCLPSVMMSFRRRLRLLGDGIIANDGASIKSAYSSLDKAYASDLAQRLAFGDSKAFGDLFTQRNLRLERTSDSRPRHYLYVHTSLGMTNVAFFPRRFILARACDAIVNRFTALLKDVTAIGPILHDIVYWCGLTIVKLIWAIVVSAFLIARDYCQALGWIALYAVLAIAVAWDAEGVNSVVDMYNAALKINSVKVSLRAKWQEQVRKSSEAHLGCVQALKDGLVSFKIASLMVDSKANAAICANVFRADVLCYTAFARAVNANVILPTAIFADSVRALPALVIGTVLETVLDCCLSELSTVSDNFYLDSENVQEACRDTVEVYSSIWSGMVVVADEIAYSVLCQVERFVDITDVFAYIIGQVLVVIAACAILGAQEVWATVKPCLPYIKTAIITIDEHAVIVAALMTLAQLTVDKSFFPGHRIFVLAAWLFYAAYQEKVKEFVGVMVPSLAASAPDAGAAAATASATVPPQDDRDHQTQSTADVHA